MESNRVIANFNRTDSLNQLLDPIKQRVTIRPLKSTEMRGTVNMVRLNHIGAFYIDSNPFTVLDEGRSYYGVTIPISSAFSVTSNLNRKHVFKANCAHFLKPDETFNFQSDRGKEFKVLVANFYTHDLPSKYEDIFKESWKSDLMIGRINLFSQYGLRFKRNLQSLFTQQNGMSQMSHAIEEELYHDLFTALRNERGFDEPRFFKERERVKLAEDYMLANLDSSITRTDLSNVTNISIRTLSRSFCKIHGVGPMEFLKLRRLESVRDELLFSYNGPIKILDLAFKFGFFELGKFSALYKNEFGELPSQTIKSNKSFYRQQCDQNLQRT